MGRYRGEEGKRLLTFATIMGRIHCLARVMVKLAITTGWKSNIFGYMSRGEMVPLVITTLWNRSRIFGRLKPKLKANVRTSYLLCAIMDGSFRLDSLSQ